MKNFDDKLIDYAKVIVNLGLNLRKNDILYISAKIDNVNLVRLVTKEAYNLNVKEVIVSFYDDEINLMKYENAENDVFETYPEWEKLKLEALSEKNASFLHISSSNPELLKNVNPERVANYSKVSNIALKKYRDRVIQSYNRWCIAAASSEGWATKVFPNSSTEDAISKLWDKIFSIVRVDKENPIKEWNKHNKNLQERVSFLNKMNFKELHYKSDKTDLVVGMHKDHIWEGGGEDDKNGIFFMPNIPTEEVFSMPHKYNVNGILHSTMPLSYGGTLIDNFSFEFKNGKIINFEAEKGYDTLKRLLETDDSSIYLGEIALVPVNSPISNSGTIFYNTLYDENASCHFALGSAYKSCIKDGNSMSEEELDKNGVNVSLVHVDFMVGSKELNINGITHDGKVIPIFEKGNWK